MPPTTDDTELDESEVLTTTAAPYVENPNHVPNPTDQYGTYDTSGTAGTAHSKLENVTPIFDVARQQDLVTAARALDPEDTEVPESIVVLPQGQNIIPIDHDAVRDEIRAKADAAMENPVVVGGPNPSQQAAAVGTDEGEETNEDKARAKAERAAEKRGHQTQSRAAAEKQVEEGRQANSPAGGGSGS